MPPEWNTIVTQEDGTNLTTTQLVVHAALLPTDEILIFSGSGYTTDTDPNPMRIIFRPQLFNVNFTGYAIPSKGPFSFLFDAQPSMSMSEPVPGVVPPPKGIGPYFQNPDGSIAALPLDEPTDFFCSGHVLLPDGSVLVAGGTGQYASDNTAAKPADHSSHWTGINDAWIYVRAQERWIRAGELSGIGFDLNQYEDTLPAKDLPPNATIPPGLGLSGGGRWYPTLLTLPDGSVMAVSGHPNGFDDRHVNNFPERFALGQWRFLPWALQPPPPSQPESPTYYRDQNNLFEFDFESAAQGDVSNFRYYPRLHLLTSGLIAWITESASWAGGLTRQEVVQRHYAPHSLDPFTGERGQFVDGAVADPPARTIYEDSTYLHQIECTSVLLPLTPTLVNPQSREVTYGKNRILMLGEAQPIILEFDDLNLTWAETAPRTFPAPAGFPLNNRYDLHAVILLSGEICVCNGIPADENDFNTRLPDLSVQMNPPPLPVEIYNPDLDQWTTDDPSIRPAVHRGYHSVALQMPDGRVWTAGGSFITTPYTTLQNSESSAGKTLNQSELTFEVYSPWYIGLPRPAIDPTVKDSVVEIGEPFSFHVWFPTVPKSRDVRVGVLLPGSSTHSFNSQQRFVYLVVLEVTFVDFESGYLVTVLAPASSSAAPPGYYLLVVQQRAESAVDPLWRMVPSVGIWIQIAQAKSPPRKRPPLLGNVPSTLPGIRAPLRPPPPPNTGPRGGGGPPPNTAGPRGEGGGPAPGASTAQPTTTFAQRSRIWLDAMILQYGPPDQGQSRSNRTVPMLTIGGIVSQLSTAGNPPVAARSVSGAPGDSTTAANGTVTPAAPPPTSAAATDTSTEAPMAVTALLSTPIRYEEVT